MGGTGAVAFADSPGDSTGGVDPTTDGGETQAPAPTAAPSLFGFPSWMRVPNFGATSDGSPRIGFIAPPIMNLPATMQPGTSSEGSSNRRLARLTLPFVIGGEATKPAGRQSAGTTTVPETPAPAGTVDTNVAAQVEEPTTGRLGATSTRDSSPTAATTGQPPTVNLVQFVPHGVPMGPPLTIKNPLRELLAPDVDWNAPVTQQLLPAPLVALLNTVSEQFPLARLLITPVMQFADAVIPLLLSDVVVPTLPLGKMFLPPNPTTWFPVGTPVKPPAQSLSPPAELAPTGMDVFQAPASPQPLSSGLEKPLAPPSPSAPDPGVAPLNDPVSYRAGYSDYLRNAGLAQITAIAVPGAAAILLFSLGGGFVGYRQARAGHVIRAEGITRFLR